MQVEVRELIVRNSFNLANSHWYIDAKCHSPLCEMKVSPFQSIRLSVCPSMVLMGVQSLFSLPQVWWGLDFSNQIDPLASSPTNQTGQSVRIRNQASNTHTHIFEYCVPFLYLMVFVVVVVVGRQCG